MAAYPYDVKFTPEGGSESYGFMLVTPPGQSKQLDINEIGGPDYRYTTRVNTVDQATHQDFQPDKDSVFSSTSFVGGLGYREDNLEGEGTYWWGNCVTHVDGKVFLPPKPNSLTISSVTTPIAGYTTYINPSGARYDFCWAGTKAYRRPADTATAWTNIWTEPNGKPITSLNLFNGVMFIFTPTELDANSKDYWYQGSPDGAWSPTGVNTALAFSNANGRPKMGLQIRGTFYAAVDNNKIFYTTDPTTDSWTGPIDTDIDRNVGGTPGDTSYPYINLAAVGDYMLAFDWQGGYSIDATQDVQETFWQWKERPNSDNFKYMAVGDDSLYFSAGSEVYNYDPATGAIRPVGISTMSGFSTREVLGVGADNQFVYILARVLVNGLRDTESVALLRGNQLSRTVFALECIWEDTSPSTKTYGGFALLPYGRGSRAYVSYVSGGNTNFVTLEASPDWDSSSDATFATSGILYTSDSRSGFPGLTKLHVWNAIDIAPILTTGQGIEIAYSLDNGDTFTVLDTLGSGDGPTLKEYTAAESRAIALRFTLSAGGTDTPVMRGFDHHQRVRFRYLPTATLGIRVADEIEMLNGARSQLTKEQISASLTLLRTAATSKRVWYEDFLGSAYWVTCDTLTMRPSHHETPTDQYEMEALLLVSRADEGA